MYKRQEIREWYDGYRFGKADVYCPWDVVNYVDQLVDDPDARPQAYWINTSGNDLVKEFIDESDATTQDEIERLIAGETITKRVRLELTYPEIRSNIDNLWSVLFTTGYLTYTCLLYTSRRPSASAALRRCRGWVEASVLL